MACLVPLILRPAYLTLRRRTRRRIYILGRLRTPFRSLISLLLLLCSPPMARINSLFLGIALTFLTALVSARPSQCGVNYGGYLGVYFMDDTEQIK